MPPALAALAVRLALARSAAPRAQTELAAAIRAFTGGAPRETGKVELDIAPLVDNGNTVPVTVSVDSPMTRGRPRARRSRCSTSAIRSATWRVFTLGPRAGKAVVSTRIRLATSQKLVAVARLSDGTYWSQTVDVVVTLAACIE